MQELSDLIGCIYDAALDPERWPASLQAMTEAFGACFAGFGWEDTRSMVVGGSYGNEARALGTDDYRARYKKILVYSNPMRVPVLLTQEVDDVFTPGMLVPVEEYRASRYFKEYVEPMGWGDGLSTILSKSDGVVHFLAFARRAADPPFNDGDISLLKLLAPHIRRAYAIGRLIGRQKAQVEALADTFDGLAAAVFILDVRKRITYANKSATALLAARAPFLVVNEQLFPSFAAEKPGFDRAWRCLRADGGLNRPAPPPLVLSGRDATRYLVHFLPLGDHARAGSSAGGKSAVALFVSAVGMDVRSPVEIIARTYDLTPREMNVLVATVDAGGIDDVAERLGLTANTVKTHLKAIFAKTGASRQADLVKLVASHLSPAQSLRDPTG